MSEKQSINFLRGVPAEEALSFLIPMASEGYEKVIRRHGVDVLQYGHFTGFKPLRDLIGGFHRVNPERVIVGNGGLEIISLFFKSLPRESNIIVEEASYDRVLLDATRYGHHLIGVQLTPEGVVPNHYVGHLSRVIANTRINPNLPTQAFIADFIESGRYDEFVKYLCNLYRPRMEALNTALNSLFPGAFPVSISGGFFAPLTLESISIQKEASFIESVQQAGVGIAAAWDAIPPNCVEEARKKGLFIRLTFPAYAPDKIRWGISKLKETTARFS